jgi:hypothetical protein
MLPDGVVSSAMDVGQPEIADGAEDLAAVIFGR